MANTFLTHRQMGEVEAYYKIFPHLNLKYSSVDTIFIPSDKKELRSKFLRKLNEDDQNYDKGTEVAGGRTGRFLEKPDIIDIFCRREIPEDQPELEELTSIHFAKMYDPIRRRSKEEDQEEPTNSHSQSQNIESQNNEEPWADDEDRVANYYITTNPNYNRKKLPKIIKINGAKEGEVPIYVKRSFPKAARIHKKRQDNDPHRFFLSELMLYTGYTDEDQLGANDEEKCLNLYLEKQDAINLIKSYMMPYAQGVEEARYQVEQAMKDEATSTCNVGDTLDPEKEKEIADCNDGDDEMHPAFLQLNPDDFEFQDNSAQVRKTIRRIENKTSDELLQDARNLDKFQKKALHVAIKFAQDVMISKKGTIPYPKAPFLMVHGGAGTGKSTLIKVMSQYVHKILMRDGDDLDCPYVLLSAFTGTAAANIDGQTLHTLFNFNYGAGFMSLTDKMRDEKRNLFKNLKLLIIDEISLVDADMLYKIDLRLREIKQLDVPFGNVGIFVLGDLMQLRPVSGRYIFSSPRSSQFELTSDMDPLWRKFDCLNLEINHRQGEDREYANILNRIRIGEETEEDIEQLKSQVRKDKHNDIRKEKDALYIYGTNKNVNRMNNLRLKQIKGEEHIIPAIIMHKTIKNFNPPEGKGGEVGKTSFQKELRLKINAKVMLTHNVDTCDGLTNGARGELVGVIKDSKENISKLIIRFEKESVGREKRKHSPDISIKFPNGTPIEKVHYSFSISKSKKSVIHTAMLIQFPLKLAFACTAHKIQGGTILKPQKLILNIEDAFGAAMVYVMLSRVCALIQILILNEFDKSKMYPNQGALEELARLNKISMNNNPSDWEKDDKKALKICSLNCRSLRKHYQDILSDDDILKSDIICLNETWLESKEITEDLKLPNYELSLNSNGRGKGIATYFKEGIFHHETDIKEDNMQLSIFRSSLLDIIVIYRSQRGNYIDLNKHIEMMDTEERLLLVIGDLNFCFLTSENNKTK